MNYCSLSNLWAESAGIRVTFKDYGSIWPLCFAVRWRRHLRGLWADKVNEPTGLRGLYTVSPHPPGSDQAMEKTKTHEPPKHSRVIRNVTLQFLTDRRRSWNMWQSLIQPVLPSSIKTLIGFRRERKLLDGSSARTGQIDFQSKKTDVPS